MPRPKKTVNKKRSQVVEPIKQVTDNQTPANPVDLHKVDTLAMLDELIIRKQEELVELQEELRHLEDLRANTVARNTEALIRKVV